MQFLDNCPVFVQNEMPLIYTGQTAILKTSMTQWLHDLISGNYIIKLLIHEPPKAHNKSHTVYLLVSYAL